MWLQTVAKFYCILGKTIVKFNHLSIFANRGEGLQVSLLLAGRLLCALGIFFVHLFQIFFGQVWIHRLVQELYALRRVLLSIQRDLHSQQVFTLWHFCTHVGYLCSQHALIFEDAFTGPGHLVIPGELGVDCCLVCPQEACTMDEEAAALPLRRCCRFLGLCLSHLLLFLGSLLELVLSDVFG